MGWKNGILGGMDAFPGREGGTWLGMTDNGKIGCLLNILQPKNQFAPNGAPRGNLVVDYLTSDKSGISFLQDIADSKLKYNEFNLLTIDLSLQNPEISYMNSKANIPTSYPPGVFGIGNAHIDNSFEKVNYGKQKFSDLVHEYGWDTSNENILIEELVKLMQSKEPHFPDAQLKTQGRGHTEEFLKALSSLGVFCPSEGYGTRTTTIVLIDQKNKVTFQERTMRERIDPHNPEWEVNTFKFALEDS